MCTRIQQPADSGECKGAKKPSTRKKQGSSSSKKELKDILLLLLLRLPFSSCWKNPSHQCMCVYGNGPFMFKRFRFKY
jgi:hypothetical protein